MMEAAVALALTPAADLEALRTKIAVMRTHQLHEPDSMTRDCLDVLEEDVQRIGEITSSLRRGRPSER